MKSQATTYPLFANGLDTTLRVRLADTFWRRLIGLISSPKLHPQEGLWITPCQRIHTLGMRWPIDVLMLNDAGTVVSLTEKLGICRLGPSGQHAGSALELASGSIGKYGFALGDQLTLGDP